MNVFDVTKCEDDDSENFFTNFYFHWIWWLSAEDKACCQGMYDSLVTILRASAGPYINCYIRDSLEYTSSVTGDDFLEYEQGLEFTLHLGMLDWGKMLWAAGCDRGEVEFWSSADMDWYKRESLGQPGSGRITEEKKSAIMAFVENIIQQPRSLRDLSRIVVRNELGCYITRKVEHLEVPRELKEYLLIPELDEILRHHKNTCTHTTDW